MRKTIKLQIVVDDDRTMTQVRQDLRASLGSSVTRWSLDANRTERAATREPDTMSLLYQALREQGWSGNPGAVSITVSDPQRTSHWPT